MSARHTPIIPLNQRDIDGETKAFMLLSNNQRLHTRRDLINNFSPSIIKLEPLYKREEDYLELKDSWNEN
jgi:hypothetical protein